MNVLRTPTLAAHALLLMVAYYVLKTVREPLLLAGGSAELKSYAQGAIAVVLLALVPLFAGLMPRFDPSRFLQVVTFVCVATLGVFAALGQAGVDVGFAYYVWVGVFGVTILAQFWSHAARSRSAEQGGQALAFVMGGASLGGLIGPPLCAALFPLLGSWRLLAFGAVLLAVTVPLVALDARGERGLVRADAAPDGPVDVSNAVSNVGAVLRNPQLRLLAVLVILVNCVNSSGEYLLSGFVLRDAAERVAANPSLDRGALVAAFYGDYFFAVNVLTVLLQFVLVRRVLHVLGVRAALVLAPLLALIGYGAVAVLPVFAVLRTVKLLENAVDYSLVNTTRQVLYLDHAAAVQRQGRAIIDTFCYRLGDLLQAAVVAVGVNALGFVATDFAWLNAGFAALWLGFALALGRRQEHPSPTSRRAAWPRFAVPAACAVCALVAFAPSRAAALEAAADQRAEQRSADLFAADEPLELSLELDPADLCRDRRAGCADVPVVLGYLDPAGVEQRVTAAVRVRGQWRASRRNCAVPPLFVAFERAAVQDTPFAAHDLLPLTTHCRAEASYEQYVLREYLAYRLYAALSDASLRVRLVRVTYRLHGERPLVRYAFFTENFATLAQRRGEVFVKEPAAPEDIEPTAAAMLELFEYFIGNTDWSIVGGHNIAQFARSDGRITVVPYDFDFSGLVDAAYATPPPQLPIRRVTDRLFRGICRPGFDWQPVMGRFVASRAEFAALLARVPALSDRSRDHVRSFVADFYAAVGSQAAVREKIVGACRTKV